MNRLPSPPSDDNKAIARQVASAFGGSPRIVSYHDETGESEVGIMHSPDSPRPGLTSFSTIGLSDYPIPGGQLQPPLGAEILGVSDDEAFATVVSTSAFCVINSGWVVEPGRAFPGVVAMHIDGVTVPNLMFVAPFLWERELATQVLQHKTVAWVLGVPITDAEFEYLRKFGSETLEDKLENAEADIYDLHRESVVRG